ncbi:growth/differentiation factor 2 isoform X2 [Scleropages formosus]|uniref:Growth differentiation factor 2 n=2 Tax=Scleropages formosus TaxID=113540 RepID=A0A8C9WAP0_SCLFO|nr:growth/differentiation factor 2-like isoform X2 [Scleropages formosus]
MQLVRSLLFPLCFSLMVSFGSCWCKPLGGIGSEEGYFGSAEEDLAEEEDTQARLESLLGNMKETLLRKLNLSAVPQEQGRIDPPPFMMELYNRYATDTSSGPQADVIRSFSLQEITRSETCGNRSEHRLLFNVSIPCHEHVTMAELRLFTLFKRPAAACSRTRATIQIYGMEYGRGRSALRFLSSRTVEAAHQSWEAFDVTHENEAWKARGQSASEFEVHIERGECGPSAAGEFDISLSLNDNSSAVLIVFSDDLRNKKDRRKVWNDLQSAITQTADRHPSGAHEEMENNKFPIIAHPRKKRQTRKDYCRRTSLRVNFKDIGWDSWIVAPMEYEAFECRGVCYFPLTDDVSPSKHALIQTLVNLSNPKKANLACCVPTKLDPITVMYQENGILTMRHLYEEMKVAACG